MNLRHLFVTLALFAALITPAYASLMSYVSDLISTSAPGTAATHTIQFTVVHAIPPSGILSITLQPGAFTIPSGFDYTDVDLAVWNGSSYVDRDLAAVPSAAEDGVAVVTGTSGSIVFTLSSTAGLAAGDKVQVRLGTNAVFGATGDTSISNPTDITSYKININSNDAANVPIDYATAMIAIVRQVTIDVPLANDPPVRSEGLPSGTLAAGNSTIEVTFVTDKTATCRYSTTPGVAYNAMTNSFSQSSGTFFYKVISGHQNGTTYTYYVRCVGIQGAINQDDYPISFTLDVTPTSDTSVGDPGGGNSGIGSFTNGSSVLYLSSVALSGYTAPGSSVVVLKDGIKTLASQAQGDGSFKAVIPNLERGTYNFGLYSLDSKGRKSASFTSTFYVNSGTNNVISGITLPPTVDLAKNSIAVGEDALVSGETVPGGSVELALLPKGGSSSDVKQFTASTTGGVGSGSGAWSITIPGKTLQRGTYTIKARTTLISAQSDYSAPVSLGVGQNASPNLAIRADINGDGKVNLIDFSIMLSFWGTSNASSDINDDNIVNLADFSILLFNWTG